MGVVCSQDVLDDMEHEKAVHAEFGPHVMHICNFDLKEVTKISAICNELDSTFVGVAFVNGRHFNAELVGVYTSDRYEREQFWTMYDNISSTLSVD